MTTFSLALTYTVYSLVFPDGSTYVGMTGDLKRRIHMHRAYLERGTAQPALQAAWDKHQSFKVVPLVTDIETKREALELEKQHQLKANQPLHQLTRPKWKHVNLDTVAEFRERVKAGEWAWEVAQEMGIPQGSVNYYMHGNFFSKPPRRVSEWSRNLGTNMAAHREKQKQKDKS